MGSPFFRTRSAPKAKCAWGVMDFVSEFFLQDDDSGYSSERVLSLSETISGHVCVDASLQSGCQSLYDLVLLQIREEGF